MMLRRYLGLEQTKSSQSYGFFYVLEQDHGLQFHKRSVITRCNKSSDFPWR